MVVLLTHFWDISEILVSPEYTWLKRQLRPFLGVPPKKRLNPRFVQVYSRVSEFSQPSHSEYFLTSILRSIWTHFFCVKKWSVFNFSQNLETHEYTWTKRVLSLFFGETPKKDVNSRFSQVRFRGLHKNTPKWRPFTHQSLQRPRLPSPSISTGLIPHHR